MNRKSFLRKSIAGAAAAFSAPLIYAGVKDKSTYDELMEPVGYNHLPNNEIKTMKSVLHKAETRGLANHGWLNSRHTFSFANYHNPERVHFGVLRVLNDDIVAAGMGFSTHPHDNMEIISIPLEGDLEHKDSMGNVAVIREGDVQVMSAGTGITHSEYNKNADREVKFLQIWVFPKTRGVKPRYDQITLDKERMRNKLHQILSPSATDEGVWIHQDAWFNLGDFEAGKTTQYSLHLPENGVYFFVLSGEFTVNGQPLNARDGYGVWDFTSVDIRNSKPGRILVMEVPMAIARL
jgi:hypothetical protein